MLKTKAQRKPRLVQHAQPVQQPPIPLEDITIRWEQPDYFKVDRAVREIGGRDLARVLSYIGRVGTTHFLSPGQLSTQAELVGALGELCHAIEEEEPAEIDTVRVLWALHMILDDMGARLAVIGEAVEDTPFRDLTLKHATVVIGATAKTEVA